jgi:M6 family metalloprotease-like protein
MPRAPSPRPRARLPLLCATIATFLAPHALRAQDVLEQARVRGVPVPASLAAELRRDTTAYEFNRAWRNKVRRVRAQRAELERRQGVRLSLSQLQGAEAAVTGTLRIPVILGLPAGDAAPYPASQYQSRLFGDVAGSYSLKTFYRENSRGVFTVDGTVSAWSPLPQPAAYYYPSDATDPIFGRDREFLRDALTAADAAMNFALFDNDGPDGVPNSGDDDGYVDAAAFVYPAHGKACGGPGIWPHRWTYTAQWGAPFSTNDLSVRGGTIKVDDYLIQGGIECDGTSLMQIGTIAHEMGHALALPDLYDTDSSNGRTQGVGEWDLMGSGNYRRPESPAHLSAWSKDFLGWVGVETVTGPTAHISLDPVYTAGRVLRYDIPNTYEYFLLEHRTAANSDLYINGSGLLVYHVDPVVIDTTLFRNRVNANPRRGVDVEEADGLDHLDLQTGGNRGDAGDPFPGSTARTTFGDTGHPGSRSNDGIASGFGLRNIVQTGGRVEFDLDGTTPPPVAMVRVVPTPVSVPQGGTQQLHAMLTDSMGGALSGRVVTWSSSSPAIATVSSTGLVTGRATGGPISIVGTSEGKSGVARVTVTEPPPPADLVPGDSVAGTISAAGQTNTHTITLAENSATDIGAFWTGGPADFHPQVEIAAPFAEAPHNRVTRLSPRATILGHYNAPATGVYQIVVRSAVAGGTGSYILRTRQTGPILAVYSAGVQVPSRPEGSTTPHRDTLWVYNAGTGPAIYTVYPGNSPWLSVSPTHGTASAGAAPGATGVSETPVDPRLVVEGAPAGGPVGTAAEEARSAAPPPWSSPLAVTMDPTGLPKGHALDTVVVRTSAPDVWNFNWKYVRQIRVSDPRAQILSTTLVPGRMALSPAGDLVLARTSDLVRVDKATGAATVWVSGISTFSGGMEFGPDSALYVALGGNVNKRVVRVAPGGTVTTMIQGTAPAYDVALLPDGTLFASMGGSLLRRGRDGVVTTALSTPRAVFTWALAYNPNDGWLYYTVGATLRRYHPGTGADELRGSLPSAANSPLIELAVGRSGRLYGTENHGYAGSVVVLDTTGALIERVWQPSMGYGLVLDEGKLFGSGHFTGWAVWAFPVSDGPAVARVLRGDPNRDGAITAQDALGVLADVVGKPLPPGWNVTQGGDADCDGEVTALDALIILSRVVGKDVSQFCIGTAR